MDARRSGSVTDTISMMRPSATVHAMTPSGLPFKSDTTNPGSPLTNTGQVLTWFHSDSRAHADQAANRIGQRGDDGLVALDKGLAAVGVKLQGGDPSGQFEGGAERIRGIMRRSGIALLECPENLGLDLVGGLLDVSLF